jgi:adenylosuccinate lyase
MGKIWTDENRFRIMMDVELAVCEGLSNLGEIPRSAFTKIRRKARFSLARIGELETKVHHDVIAFLSSFSESVGKEGRYIHLGLTSSDILDTALAIQMVEAIDILIDDVEKLSRTLKKRAIEHKNTIMMGRTHGVHAEPTTFGLKLALWYEETLRNLERLRRAREVIAVGKISGAVGTYAHINPKVELYVCKKFRLKPDPISTQIIQRDRHAEYLSMLALVAGSLEKFALEIRNLQRTEILEVEEYFTPTQKGSSAMPHKRNPITCERICGLARIVRSNALPSLENIPLWHERDITHSSAERVIIPDSTILLDYMLQKFEQIVMRLVVYPENMEKNLEKSKNTIFSQRVLLELVKKGLSRERAYELTQRNAMRAWKEGSEYRELLKKDREMEKYLTKKEIDACFNLRYYLRYVDRIFKRLKLEGR